MGGRARVPRADEAEPEVVPEPVEASWPVQIADVTWPRFLRVRAGSFAIQHRVPIDVLLGSYDLQRGWLETVVRHLREVAREQFPGLETTWRVCQAGEDV